MPHILIVDDEDILALLTGFFERHAHAVSVATDGPAMFVALEAQAVDLVILDLILQGEDGFSLCRRLRAASNAPVIMLTANGEHTDRVVGLGLGADDYLVKSFGPRELLARLKAVLRRAAARTAAPASTATRPILSFAGWRLDAARRELRSGNNTLMILSGGEFDPLLAFAEHPQRVLSRDQLLDLARGATHAAYDRSIDVQVSRPRRRKVAMAQRCRDKGVSHIRGDGFNLSGAAIRRAEPPPALLRGER